MTVTRPAESTGALVQHAQKGDRGAFDQLVRRYRPRIFALCLQFTGRESEADDLTQDVFLRAYRAIGDFQGRCQFMTWIYRMGINLSLNATRNRRRRRETIFDDARIRRALCVDVSSDPLQIAHTRRVYERLLVALDNLPMRMRSSVVLVTLQGLSQADAAQIQGCSCGTVSWHIHEARRRLREALEHDLDVEDRPLTANPKRAVP